MARDIVYIFDKITHAGTILGEIQSDFNMSLTIDGTKDSWQVIVLSYDEHEIEPYSIIQHPKTDTWWVVSHDKVERYQNENGFLYFHNLELLGAIELFNARDLTDCGFNQKKYTVLEFLQRLMKLSNFEPFYSSGGSINEPIFTFLSGFDGDKKVEFVKTFENYTLLSAMREFLDGYNLCPKLRFDTGVILGTGYALQRARIDIYSKTGNSTLASHTMSHFDDARETKTMDKNSFGACVVSNAENVISSRAKTYPLIGGVKTSSHEFNVKAENAVIRLPSKVYKPNWLALVTSQCPIYAKYELTEDSSFANITLNLNVLSKNSFDNMFDYLKSTFYEYLESQPLTEQDYEDFCNQLDQERSSLENTLTKLSTIKLYDGAKINATTGVPEQGDDMPYFVHVDYYSQGDDNEPMVLVDKETKSMLKKPFTGIAWQRGSDELTGFEGFEPVGSGRSATIYVRSAANTDLQNDAITFSNQHGGSSPSPSRTVLFVWTTTIDGHEYKVSIITKDEYYIHFNRNDQWIFNYIPMSDIKIKVDNQRDKKDVQYYNQNGKLTDNFALSKLLNSYSKEISSDTITRYMHYYNFNDIPKLGSFVTYNGDNYVINNISMNFVQNEHKEDTSAFDQNKEFGYYIDCEFTMSKYYSTKSLMTNPNTNIRDYGIPQNFNVKRKQVYRDYYELNYSQNEDNYDIYYLDPSNVFNFGEYPTGTEDYLCIMRLHYEHQVEGSYNWYYQLDTTRYEFNKMFYIILDFKDNNIIGYGSQNTISGFNVGNLFASITGNTNNTINTPISYVDENGECQGFRLNFLKNEDAMRVWDTYLSSQSSVSGYATFVNRGGTLYNMSVFIPSTVYSYARSNATMIIDENDYYKDATEVPVFEYGCQVEDTKEVIVGDNIFTQYSKEYIYFYSYVKGTNLNQENVQPSEHISAVTNPIGFRLFHTATFEYVGTSTNKRLKVQLHSYTRYDVDAFQNWSYGPQEDISPFYDYAIFRHAYNLRTGEEIVDLMLICKNVPNTTPPLSSGILTLEINHYKLN